MKKDIEVVQGDGSDLNISDVGEHIPDLRPKRTPKKKVVIPPTKKDK